MFFFALMDFLKFFNLSDKLCVQQNVKLRHWNQRKKFIRVEVHMGALLYFQ